MDINTILHNLINVTPHAVTICIDGVDHVFPPSGLTIRLKTDTTVIAPGIVSSKTSVPDLRFDPNAYYFVSGMVAAADLPTGLNVVYPPTDDNYIVRNDKGHVVKITAVQVK